VAPATFNTVNKLRAGIADNMAVGVLCECLRPGYPSCWRPTSRRSSPSTPPSGQSPRAGVLGRSHAGTGPPARRDQDGALGGHPCGGREACPIAVYPGRRPLCRIGRR
jgi:hypothetical protein